VTYRVGNHQPQNVYRDDRYIGVMFTAEDAALAVEALNGADGPKPLRDADLTPEQAEQFAREYLAAFSVADVGEHRASSPGGDGLGYGPCAGCGELWPCKPSRGAR
jgi:hypothetical protein